MTDTPEARRQITAAFLASTPQYFPTSYRSYRFSNEDHSEAMICEEFLLEINQDVDFMLEVFDDIADEVEGIDALYEEMLNKRDFNTFYKKLIAPKKTLRFVHCWRLHRIVWLMGWLMDYADNIVKNGEEDKDQQIDAIVQEMNNLMKLYAIEKQTLLECMGQKKVYYAQLLAK